MACQCGVVDSKFSFISDTGNVIFRSDTAKHSYCVRIYQEYMRSTPEINGELYWLLDLRQNTDLIVPEPVKNTQGNVVQEISAPDHDGNRIFCNGTEIATSAVDFHLGKCGLFSLWKAND